MALEPWHWKVSITSELLDVLQGIMIPVEWVEGSKLHPSIGKLFGYIPGEAT